MEEEHDMLQDHLYRLDKELEETKQRSLEYAAYVTQSEEARWEFSI